MGNIIKINIETKTAREQLLLSNLREQRMYYEDCYEVNIKEESDKIIMTYYPNCWFDIRCSEKVIENKVRNIIEFEFYNVEDVEFSQMHKDLEIYIIQRFEVLFNCV